MREIHRCVNVHGKVLRPDIDRPAKFNEFVSYFREYVSDGIPRYDHAVDGNPVNEEIRRDYDPMPMPRNGYDTHEG